MSYESGTGKHARHWERNPWEAAARQKKAFALAARLHQHEITADEAERMTVNQWNDVAKVAGLHKPGKDGETIRLAIEKLREMEAERPKPTAEEVRGYFRRCRS